AVSLEDLRRWTQGWQEEWRRQDAATQRELLALHRLRDKRCTDQGPWYQRVWNTIYANRAEQAVRRALLEHHVAPADWDAQAPPLRSKLFWRHLMVLASALGFVGAVSWWAYRQKRLQQQQPQQPQQQAVEGAAAD